MSEDTRLRGFHKSREDREADKRRERQEKKDLQLDRLDEAKLESELSALQRASFLAPHQKERKAKIEGWLAALAKRREGATTPPAGSVDPATDRKRSRQEDDDDDDADFGDEWSFLGERRRVAPTAVGEGPSTAVSDRASDSDAAVEFLWRGIIDGVAPPSATAVLSSSACDVARPAQLTTFVPRQLLQRQLRRPAGPAPAGDDGAAARRVELAKEAEARIVAAAEMALQDGESVDSILDSFS
jgi:hypothetical protein